MLSDDDIQRVAIQCGMKSGQHWNKGRMNTSKMRSFARAIEREVRKQVLEDAAHPDAVEALRRLVAAVIDDEGDDPGNAPGHAHSRPGIWDDDNEPAIAGKPCEKCAAWSNARAVLAAQGDDR